MREAPASCTRCALRPGHPGLGWLGALITGLALAGCGGGGAVGGPGSHALRVVAAENFWGSIASQLGGNRVSVQSIIVNPAQDPHSYEPTAADARTLAGARLAIVNGIGYDPWAPKLLAANPVPGRLVLTVGDLLGVAEGGNPHRWYDPSDVEAVANAISADLRRLAPTDASYLRRRRTVFEHTDLARYRALIAQIRSRYAGVAVGASESIFALQAPALGLRLITPAGLMKAVSEGSEVTAQDTATAEHQISDRAIKIWVYDSQNVTPEIQRLNRLARAQRIPVAAVTETLSPPGDSFEQWQVAQLQAIERALQAVTGR